MSNKIKIAIVYDWMDKMGGVERMLLTLSEMYPEADWHTSYVDYHKADWVSKILKQVQDDQRAPRIKTSFIQKFPSFIKSNRILSLPFYPYAFESFNFSQYDLVISVTSSFAKSIITHPNTKHVCILLTPTRWLWGMTDTYLKSEIRNPKSETNLNFPIPNIKTSIINRFITGLKKWDYVAAQRPDKIISISQTVAGRCNKYYGRESSVIYPPFDEGYWEDIKSEIRISKYETNTKYQILNTKYYLVVSRLESYKKVDLVVKAFASMQDKRLVIVGNGTQASKLRSMATSNITFIQDATDIELAQYYSNAQALIMPQEEDFGYVSLEAQYFGCPVISYNKGGARETIINGKTGMFFTKQSYDAIRYAVAHFKRAQYNLGDRRTIFSPFSKKRFINEIQNIV